MKLKNPLLVAADMGRFLDSAMTAEEAAERIGVPVEYVKERAR